MNELTETKANVEGFKREGRYYIKRENADVVYAEALPNGNCPVGGEHFHVMNANEFYLCNTELLEQ